MRTFLLSMNANGLLKLEELILGKKQKLDFQRSRTTNRDVILDCLHRLIMSGYPDSHIDGNFLDSDNYIVYELQVHNDKIPSSSIRVLDFGDKFTILRV